MDEEPRRLPRSSASGASLSSRAFKVSLCLFLSLAACDTPFQHDLFSVLSAPKAYTIVLSAGTGGKVSATTPTENYGESSTLSIKAGKEEIVNIEAKSDTGYSFQDWVLEQGTASLADCACSTTSLTIQASNASVAASFALVHCLLSLSAGDHGSIAAPTTGAGTVSVGYNEKTTIVAVPDSGYRFAGWSVVLGTGNAIIADPSSATTAVALTGPATLKASFTNVTHALTVVAAAGGSIQTPSTGSEVVAEMNPVPIVAIPGSGYSFVRWDVTSGGANATIGDPLSASTTVSLKGDATLTASFASSTCALTLNLSPAAGGSVSVGGSAVANGGTATLGNGVPTTLSATPAASYGFTGWTITNGAGYATLGNAGNASTTITLTGAATVQANFSLINWTPSAFTITKSDGTTALGSPDNAFNSSTGALAFTVSASLHPGQSILDTRIIETALTAQGAASGTPVVTDLHTYSSTAMPYTLKTTGQGYRLLQVQVEDNNNQWSTILGGVNNLYGAVVAGQTVYDTYKVLYDTIPAVVSNLSLNSGSAYAKSGAISLGFVSSKSATPAAVLTGYMIKDSTGTPTTPGIGDTGWTPLTGSATSYTGTSIPYTIASFGDSVSSNVYVYVKDEAGNIGSMHAAIIGDTTPPSLSLGSITSNNGNPLYATTGNTIRLNFTASDTNLNAESGLIATKNATITNTSGNNYTATWQVVSGDAQGVVGYSVTVTDKAGNSTTLSSGATGTVTIDTVAPNAPTITVQPTTMTNTTFSLTVNGSTDPGGANASGFSHYAITSGVAGVPVTSTTGTFAGLTAAAQGNNMLTIVAYDVAGNVSTGVSPASPVFYDNVPPNAPTITVQPPTLTNTTFGFTVSSTDPGGAAASGISHYAITSGVTGVPVTSTTGTFAGLTAAAQGNNTLTIVAYDVAGNVSSGVSPTSPVFYDNVSPNTPTITMQPPTMTNTTFGLTVNGSTDPGGVAASGFSHYAITSGVAGVPVTSTTGTFSGLTAASQGNNTLTIVAYDVAGNVSTGVSPTSPVFYDNVPPNAPTITVQPPTLTNTTFGCTVSSTDPGGAAASGISHYAITSGVTGVPVTSTTGTFAGLTAAAQGNNALTIVAYDVAGNVSTGVSPTSPVFYDNVPPNAPTMTVQPPTMTNTTFGLTVNGSTDPGGANASGFSHYAITSGVTGAPVTSTTGTFAGLTAAVQGNNTLTIVAYDVAGNVSTGVSPASPVFYDNVPPNAPTITVQPTTMTNTTFGLTVSSTDPGGVAASGFSHYAITSGVTGVPVTSTTGTFAGLTAAAQGNNTLTIVAYDVAGNVSTGVSPTSPVFYDNVPPNTPTITLQPPTVTNTTFGCTVSSIDPGGAAASGISHYAITSGVTGAPVTSTTGFFAGLTAAAQGNNTLTIVAYDVAGNVSSGVSPTSPVFYDNVPPNAPTITVQPPTLTNTTFSLTVNGSTDPGGANASGFSHYAITSGVTGVPVTSTTGAFSGLTAASQGNNTLTIVAYDVAGNVSSGVSPTSPVFYDNVPPNAPTITVQPPTVTNTTFGFTVSSTDPGGAAASGISHYAITSGVTGVPVTSTTGIFAGLTAAAQGNNALTIVAYDVAGNVSSGVSPTSPVFYDNVPPNAPTMTVQPPTMTNTTFGLTVNGSTDPGGANASGFSHYAITSGVTGVPVTSTTGTFAGLTAAAQGNNTLTIVAYDVAGNVSSDVSPTSPVFYDNVPPNAPTITVQPTTMTNTTFGCTVSSTDPGGVAASGISHYAITSGVTGVPVTSTTGTFSGLTAAAQGNNTLTIVAYDVAGNVSSGVSPASPVFYDNVSPSAPTITVQPPTLTNATFGLTVNGSTDPGGVAASGISHYAITSGVTGVPVTSTTGTFSGLTAAAQGNNTLTIVAYDVAGNVSTGVSPTSPVFYDNVSPNTPTITVQPTTMTNTTFGLTVNGSTDPGGANASGFSYYAITSGVTGVPVTSATGTFSGLTAASQGNNTLTIVAYDVAGNVSSSVSPTSPVFYDNVPPTGLSFPTPAYSKTQSVTINVGATDGTGSGIASYKVSGDVTSTSTVMTTATSTAITFNLMIGDGPKSVTLTATDAAGNNSTIGPQAIILDTMPPIIGGLALMDTATSNDGYTTGPVTLIVGGATDGTGSGIASYEYQVNSGTWTTVPIAGSTGTIILTGPDGSKAVNIRAIDAVGNVGTVYGNSTIVLDTTPPNPSGIMLMVNNAGPNGAANQSSTVTGTWDVSGDPSMQLGTLSVSIDFTAMGGGTKPASYSSGTKTWTATSTASGAGAINGVAKGVKVTATDTAGNTASAVSSTTTVPVDNQPPNPAGIALSVNSAGPNGAANQSSTVTGTWDVSGDPSMQLGTLSVSVDFTAMGGGTKPASYSSGTKTWSATSTASGSGSINGVVGGVKVTATDTAGNTASAVPSTQIVYVDNQPPSDVTGSITIDEGTTPGTIDLYGWVGGDPDVDHFYISWTGGGENTGSLTNTDPACFTPVLSNIPYTFTIYAVDAAGNMSVGRYGGTITPNPVTSLIVGMATVISGPTLTVHMSAGTPTNVVYWSGDVPFPSSGRFWLGYAGDDTPMSLSGLGGDQTFGFCLYNNVTNYSISYTFIYAAGSYSAANAKSLFPSSVASKAGASRTAPYSSSSRTPFPTPVFTDTPSTYGQTQPNQVVPPSKLSTDLVMEPISMRFAPAVASQTAGRSIDSSGLSIIQRYLKAAAAMAAGTTAVATQDANAMNAPSQNVRYSVPMTASEASATETTDVRPLPVSGNDNTVPALGARATTAVAAPLPRSQKNPVPKGETVPRPDFCLGESKKERDAGEESLEDET